MKIPAGGLWPSAPSMTRTVFLGLTPVLIFLIGFLSLSNYYAARRQIIADVQQEIEILARQASENLSFFFNQRRHDAREIAEAPLLRDYLKYLDYDLKQEAESYRKELSFYYDQFARKEGVYSRIAYWDRAGREQVAVSLSESLSAGFFHPPANASAAPGSVEDTGIQQGRVEAIRYWTEVFSDQGRLAGYVVLTCDLKHVRRLLDRTRVGSQGRVCLVDAQGHELLTSQPVFPDPVTAEASIAGTSWKIRLMAKPEEFITPLRKVQRWAALASLLSGIFLVTWIGYWARKIIRPIEAMAEGTKRIASGDLDFRFESPPIQELLILGGSFNDMTRSLKERTRELEARIRELTAIRQMEDAVIQRLDEETILRTCLKAVAKGLSFDRTGLYWVDSHGQEISGRYVYGTEAMGLTEEAFQKRRIPLGADDILNEVIRSRTSLLVKNPAETPRINPKYVEEAKTREFLLAPIYGKDRVFGVLTADNCYGNRPLTESDKDGLTLFACAAGMALDNATLFRHLAESEARYRTVLENSPVAVLGISEQQRITTWNRGAETIFGYRASEILGKPLKALFPAEAGDEFTKLLSLVMEKGSIRDHAMTGAAKNARRLDLSLSWGGALPDFWLNKEWTIVIRDVTESKKLQQQLIRSEKLSAVGQLISGIAHELNNPLQAVVGYAQLLSAGNRETFEEDMRLILDSAVRCRKIIDNLLVFVRQGKVEMRPTRVPQIIRAAIDLLSYKLKKAQVVKVRLSLPRGLPMVNADSQQIQQVLVNLINNACDAMAETRAPKELRIAAAATDLGVKIEIADSGPGVPEELKDRIFEPFFSTKPEGIGTGLGLPICRQIVQDHGGAMGLRNRAGGGTIFWIQLPAAPTKALSKNQRKPSSPRLHGKSILIVDDELPVLGFLKRILETDGHRVDGASSWRAATSHISRNYYDLVVADVQLGEETGLNLHDHWNRYSHLPKPEFLFITGDVLNVNIQQTLQHRKLALLHKPVEIEDFKRTAYTLLMNRKEKKHAG